MNDKYKDIALECSVKYIASPEWIFTDAELKQFVELIVKECASFKKELSQFDGSTPYGDGYEQGLKDMTATFMEHFGVEE